MRGTNLEERVGRSGRGGNPISGWLADRRIATKLLLVAGVAIAAAAAVGGLALVEVEQLRQTRQLEMGHEVPYITGLQSAALGAKAAANDERGFPISGEQEFRDEVQERLAKVRASLAQARGAATTDQQRQAVDKIRQGIEGWFTAIETEFDQYANDKPGAVKAAFGQNRELRKSYEKLLDAETTAAADRLSRGQDFTWAVNTARLQVLVLLVTGLALALWFALYLARLIVVPMPSPRRPRWRPARPAGRTGYAATSRSATSGWKPTTDRSGSSSGPWPGSWPGGAAPMRSPWPRPGQAGWRPPSARRPARAGAAPRPGPAARLARRSRRPPATRPGPRAPPRARGPDAAGCARPRRRTSNLLAALGR